MKKSEFIEEMVELFKKHKVPVKSRKVLAKKILNSGYIVPPPYSVLIPGHENDDGVYYCDRYGYEKGWEK